MNKKLIYGIVISIAGIIMLFLILLVPVLLILNFFDTTTTTDGYITENIEYADKYRTVVNEYIKQEKGYVSLERILYFYQSNNSLTFKEIYEDNLDKESKKMIPISEVCKIEKYKELNVCSTDELDKSKQKKEYQGKPFAKPINFSSIKSISSFFMEERITFGEKENHNGWDFAAPALTPVYATCDGIATKVSFPFKANTQKIGSNGNEIVIKCDSSNYIVTYAHLYPNSNKIKQGHVVSKGQNIAGVGTTGNSTGNHLHYQVSLNNKLLDGMSLVDFST